LKNRKSISVVGVLTLFLLAVTAPAFSAPAKRNQLKTPTGIVVTPAASATGEFTVTWTPLTIESTYTVRVYDASGKCPSGCAIPAAQNPLIVDKNPGTTYRITVQALPTNTTLYSPSPESGKYTVSTFASAYAITVTQGANGTIAPETISVNYGSSQTFTFTPATDYSVASITVDGAALSAEDLATTISSGYTFSNVTATHTLTATYSPTITPVAPAIATATITGAPAVGEILTAVAAGVTGTPSPSESYQWQSADPTDSVYSDISGGTSSTYTVLSGDAGKYIRVVITESNGVEPAASATSAATDTIAAEAVQCGTGKYLVTTAGVAKSGSSCTGPVTISSSVTSIANYGFEISGITNLIIPGNVITIGQGAFSSTALTSLTLQEGIQSIGFGAFSTGTLYDTAPILPNVVLPDSLTSLGGKAFFQTRIGNLTIGSGLSTIPSEAFYNNWACGTQNVLFKVGNLTTISEKSFIGTCATTVSIPSGVTSIGKKAFDSSTIATIRLPFSLETIFSNGIPSDGILGTATGLLEVQYCGTNSAVLNYPYFNSVTLTCVAGTASAATSTVSVSPASIIADGTATAAITVQLKDFNGNNLTTDGATVTFANPSTGTIGLTTNNNNGTYSATYTAGNTSGSVTITPKLSDVDFTNTTSITLTTSTPSTPVCGSNGMRTSGGSGACQVGDIGPGGGFIYYYDSAGFNCGAGFSGTGSPTGDLCHYLEVAPNGWNGGSDPRISWASPDNQATVVTGAGGIAIGTGLQNSIDISAQSGNVAATSAAVAALAYTGGSKSDWYLPSKDELNELCKFARTIPTGLTSELCPSSGGTQKAGFTWSPAGDYWSSTEGSGNAYGLYQYFNTGPQGETNKNFSGCVRPIRAF
jgi:hypothetical protein